MFHVKHSVVLQKRSTWNACANRRCVPRGTLCKITLHVSYELSVEQNASVICLHLNLSLQSCIDSDYSALALDLLTIQWDASSRLPTRRAAWARPRLPSIWPRPLPQQRSTLCSSIAIRNRMLQAA